MQTLDAPVYEVKQDSEWYKKKRKNQAKITEFFKKVNNEYFKDNGFSFYHSESFGVLADSEDYETYKDEVCKNPNKDGIHIFKKRSKYFNVFKGLIEQIKIEAINPFKSHDVLGTNNITGSQWLGDRWFFGVKQEEFVTGEEVTLIDYKDYLKRVMDVIENNQPYTKNI